MDLAPLNIASIIFGVVCFVCILIGVPLVLVNSILMARHKKPGALTWRDWWGLKKASLVMYPDMLDGEGQRHRIRLLHGLRILLVAVIAAFIAVMTGILEV